MAGLLADLRRDRSLHRIRLTGLTPKGVRQLMAGVDGHQPPPALADAVRDETEGNPFFVEEMATHLLETGRGPSDDNPWTHLGTEHLGLPDSVREVVGHRLARLLPDTNRAITVGAVEGRQFRLDVVRRVTGMPLDHAVGVLDEAVRAQLLIETTDLPGRYSFSHALVRDALIADLGPTPLAHLHMQVAEAVEAVFGHDLTAHLSELAHHYLAAGGLADPDRALECCVGAGRQAMHDLAYEQAVSHFDAALQILEGIAPSSRSQQARRCELLIELGGAHNRAGHGEEGRRAYAQAGRQASDVDRPDLLAEAALGYGQVVGKGLGFEMGVYEQVQVELLEAALGAVTLPSPLGSRLLARLALARLNAPEASHSDDLSRQAVGMARDVGDTPALARALTARHGVVWASEPPARRLDLIDEVLRAPAEKVGADTRLLAHIWRLTDLLELGDRDGVDDEYEAFTGLLRRLRLPEFQWYIPMFGSMLALLDGDLGKAEALAGEMFESTKRFGDPGARQSGASLMLVLLIEQGRHPELADMLLRFIKDYPGNPTWRCPLVTALARAGDPQRARAELDALAVDGFAALPHTSVRVAGLAGVTEGVRQLGAARPARSLYRQLSPRSGQVVVIGQGIACLGAVDHWLGTLAATTGDEVSARHHLAAAATTHARLRSPPWRARTLLQQARLALDSGHRQEAMDALDGVARHTAGLVLPDITQQAEEVRRVAR